MDGLRDRRRAGVGSRSAHQLASHGEALPEAQALLPIRGGDATLVEGERLESERVGGADVKARQQGTVAIPHLGSLPIVRGGARYDLHGVA